MRVAARIDVAAPPELVWAFVTDPTRTLDFMSGVTRWEAVSARDRGLGARYRTLMRVGSADVGGLVETVEYDEPWDIALTSVTGLDQRWRWRLRGAGPERTRVELRISYGVAGAGIAGWIAEHVAAPTVRGNVRRSLLELRRQVEHERARARAAARRHAARAT
jgi:carbon monoxide dehydrogenase subunit G